MRRTKLNTEWRPEIDKALLRLASTDAKFSLIAIQLNAVFGTTFTKNAVIGRYHRTFGAKTSRRTRGAEEIAEAKRNPKPKPPAKPAATGPRRHPPVLVRPVSIPVHPASETVRPVSIPHPSTVQVPAATGPVTLLDREPWQCCFPVNDGNPYLFCGAEKRKARSERDTAWLAYCDVHFRKMIVKPRRWGQAEATG